MLIQSYRSYMVVNDTDKFDVKCYNLLLVNIGQYVFP